MHSYCLISGVGTRRAARAPAEMDQPPAFKTRRTRDAQTRRLELQLGILHRHMLAADTERARALKQVRQDLRDLRSFPRGKVLARSPSPSLSPRRRAPTISPSPRGKPLFLRPLHGPPDVSSGRGVSKVPPPSSDDVHVQSESPVLSSGAHVPEATHHEDGHHQETEICQHDSAGGDADVKRAVRPPQSQSSRKQKASHSDVHVPEATRQEEGRRQQNKECCRHDFTGGGADVRQTVRPPQSQSPGKQKASNYHQEPDATAEHDGRDELGQVGDLSQQRQGLCQCRDLSQERGLCQSCDVRRGSDRNHGRGGGDHCQSRDRQGQVLRQRRNPRERQVLAPATEPRLEPTRASSQNPHTQAGEESASTPKGDNVRDTRDTAPALQGQKTTKAQDGSAENSVKKPKERNSENVLTAKEGYPETNSVTTKDINSEKRITEEDTDGGPQTKTPTGTLTTPTTHHPPVMKPSSITPPPHCYSPKPRSGRHGTRPRWITKSTPHKHHHHHHSQHHQHHHCPLAGTPHPGCNLFPCAQPSTYHSLGFHPDPSPRPWRGWVVQNACRPHHRLAPGRALPPIGMDGRRTPADAAGYMKRKKAGKEEVVRQDMARKKQQHALARPQSWNTNYGQPTSVKRLNNPVRASPLE